MTETVIMTWSMLAAMSCSFLRERLSARLRQVVLGSSPYGAFLVTEELYPYEIPYNNEVFLLGLFFF